MAMQIDLWAHPDALNTVLFAKRFRTPGVCKVTGFSRDNEYDVKTGKGTAGATETLKGQPPAKGSIEFTVWTVEQMAAWNPILAVLKFDPAKAQSGQGTTPTTTAAAGSTFTIGETKNGSVGGTASATIPEPGNTSGKADGASKTKSTDPPALSAASAIQIFHPFLDDIGVRFVLPPEKLGAWELQDDFRFTRKIDFLEFSQPPNASIAATPTGADDSAGATGDTPAGGSDPPATKNPAGSGSGKDAAGSWGAP